MEAKNAVFQRLKPPCVALSQAALALNGSRGDIKAVTDHLETLKYTLECVSSNPNALDAKLSEYIFFPISQVLKASKRASIRVLEISLQCVAVLIDRGWRQDIPPQLAAQIVILCSLLGERTPKGLAFVESTDELQAAAFWCLHHLFSIVERDSKISELLTTELNFPPLGQTISVLLDGIEDGRCSEVQIAATSALEALVTNMMETDTQAGFLPGIVSKVTRVLTPQTKSRRTHKVLIGCLSILGNLLENTLGDHRTSRLVNSVGSETSSDGQHGAKSTIITERWRKEAADQLKPAITNIMKLKVHSRDDVRDSLSRLCFVLLKRCSKTLAKCSNIALETLITICAADPKSYASTELRILISTDSTASRLLQTIVYDWLHSLTTTMQSSDEQAKTLKIRQINRAYELLVQAGTETSGIDRLLAAALRDSVFITLTVPGTSQQDKVLPSYIQSMDLIVSDSSKISMQFNSPLIRFKGQESLVSEIQEFTNLISSSPTSSAFAADLARNLRQSYGGTQIANFWLLLTATQNALDREDDLDGLLNFELEELSPYNAYLDELYSFSLMILTESSDQDIDPRLRALALRTLALRAQIARRDFRYELVDALYPVLHTLATPNEDLQRDGLTTLNIFASCCGYSSVRDLVVENVDYLTNAVALKLNAFDVSPQAPQVLLMMVRLAGPSLLPYLEDTVESIFAALEDYHGYPLLVELLFNVLGVIAEEGVKAPQLQIITEKTAELNSILRETWQPTTIAGLANSLRESVNHELEANQTTGNELEAHPKRPWKNNDEATEPDEDSQTSQQDQQIDDVEAPPPSTKTYNVLFKITELTQHFLPSASSSLRPSLLSLIGTTVPAIARHESSFLPLINTLWPEVVSRIDDDEPFVVAKAIDVMNLLCAHARDFMRTRIVQIWPRFEELYNATLRSVLNSSFHEPSRVVDSVQLNPLLPNRAQESSALSSLQSASQGHGATTANILWSSLISCLLAIVQFVPITPEMVDDALRMLQPAVDEAEIQKVFARENSDALWLTRLRSGSISMPVMPKIPESIQWRFVSPSG